MIDPGLRKFATDVQIRYLDAIEQAGSLRGAATLLGVNKDQPRKVLERVKLAAAARGYSPEHGLTREIAPGYLGRGHSTMDRIHPDGSRTPIIQWTKTKADDAAREAAMREAFEAMAGELPRLDPIEPPAANLAALCTLYTFTDYHLGMLAWHREAGADWDVKIAERLLVAALEQLVAGAPRSRKCILNLQGDFLHYDGLTAVTPLHGHVLDADGRFSNMVAAAIRVIRRLIDICLMRHAEVHVVVAEGNHDIASSVWLRQMFTALYEKDPRLTVNNSELPYYVFQHGKVMLAFHHGHMKKNDQLPLLFAAQFAKMWGETTKRYCHTGHRHHTEEREHSGMTVIQHPTLAARDAYAARGGWISERQASAITYHAEFGQVGRNTVTPEMLDAA
jgi:hypothetical protein